MGQGLWCEEKLCECACVGKANGLLQQQLMHLATGQLNWQVTKKASPREVPLGLK